MSSSRRRGRSSGAPVNSQPPTLTAPQSEVADALLAETQGDQDQTGPGQQPEVPETTAADVPTVEAAAPAADAAPESSGPTAEPTEAQAAEGGLTIEHPVQDAAEVAAVPTVPEPIVSEAAEAAETAVEAANETLARTLAETEAALGAPPKPHSVHIGASFAFVPTFAPLTEINAKLFAFARGEGEAAIAHIQALARAKSPAEAIRLQVTEMQRAADASLTCFSEIVRSANRFSDGARRH
ncbi:immunoglobulin A1 protease [Methylorubrum populi]|uniref:Immunoglobulin A1 protease n=1 Tax=Methylorubrum populi TaxID=223967 RepID=A0A169R0E1_9HYPH|nr:phasin family protein [Methylorubrum populi]BAU90932.1 immunoglobulin A1 protease [Methylorubrum populi]